MNELKKFMTRIKMITASFGMCLVDTIFGLLRYRYCLPITRLIGWLYIPVSDDPVNIDHVRTRNNGYFIHAFMYKDTRM